MANYTTKPEHVQAWQYTSGSDSIPLWVGPYVKVEARTQGYKLVTGAVGDRRDGRGLRDIHDNAEVEMGNWLVKDSHGVWLYDARTFKNRFEAAPEEGKK